MAIQIISASLITLLIVLIVQSFIMFRRWGHKIYILTTAAFSYAALVCLLTGSEITNNGAAAVSIGFSGGAFILVQLSLFQFYNPKTQNLRNRFAVPAAVITLLPLVLSFVNGSFALIAGIVGIVLYSIYAYMYLSPYFSGQLIYIGSIFLFATATITHSVEVALQSSLLISQLLMLFSYFLIFLLNYSRILDITQGITEASAIDGLTGLYNSRYIRKRANDFALDESLQAVLLIDIDHFKKINDTMGHPKGDEVLQRVSQVVQDETEGKGLAGRYGGEELLVLLNNAPNDNFSIAERIRKRVEKDTIVTVSIGYAYFSPGELSTEVIKQADDALYRAKHRGRNQVVNYHEMDRPMADVEQELDTNGAIS